MKKLLTLALAAIMILSVLCLPVFAVETETITVTEADIAEMKQKITDAFDIVDTFFFAHNFNSEVDDYDVISHDLVWKGNEWSAKDTTFCRRTDKYAKWSDTQAAMEGIFAGDALAIFDNALPIEIKDGYVYLLMTAYTAGQLSYSIEREDDMGIGDVSLSTKFVTNPIDADSVKVTFEYAEVIDVTCAIHESTAILTKTDDGWRIEESDFIDMICEHPFPRVAPQTGVATVALAIMALVSGGYVVARKKRK